VLAFWCACMQPCLRAGVVACRRPCVLACRSSCVQNIYLVACLHSGVHAFLLEGVKREDEPACRCTRGYACLRLSVLPVSVLSCMSACVLLRLRPGGHAFRRACEHHCLLASVNECSHVSLLACLLECDLAFWRTCVQSRFGGCVLA
jgi:hypothetical protein